MTQDPTAIDAIRLLAEIVSIALFWNIARYTVFFRPLTISEKFTAFLGGMPAGIGMVRLYTHPNLSFFSTQSWIAFGLTICYALAVVFLVAFVVNAGYWIVTRRPLFR